MKRHSAIVTALLLLGLTAFWHSHPASGQADAMGHAFRRLQPE
jgi:hypothetical protein